MNDIIIATENDTLKDILPKVKKDLYSRKDLNDWTELDDDKIIDLCYRSSALDNAVRDLEETEKECQYRCNEFDNFPYIDPLDDSLETQEDLLNELRDVFDHMGDALNLLKSYGYDLYKCKEVYMVGKELEERERIMGKTMSVTEHLMKWKEEVEDFERVNSIVEIKMITGFAFFDIDGVLSIPRYMKDGKLVPGGSDEWWKEFCESNEHPYEQCRVPYNVKSRLRALHNMGCELYVLSQESFEAGERAKRDFIHMRYKEFFSDDHIIFVPTNADKIKFMLDMSRDRDFKPGYIEYWDDTFSNVLKASVAGIDAHHISELLGSGINVRIVEVPDELKPTAKDFAELEYKIERATKDNERMLSDSILLSKQSFGINKLLKIVKAVPKIREEIEKLDTYYHAPDALKKVLKIFDEYLGDGSEES